MTGDAGTNGNYQVNIHAILGNSTWTESTVTWNSVSNYSDTVYAYQTLGYSYWSTFDITNLALKWKSGELNGQCGLIMVANDESQYIVTCSTDYTYSTLWPYVVVTYETAIALNYSVKDVDEGRSFTLTATVDPETSGTISWISSNESIASVSASGHVIGHLAGKATITATHTDENGETASATCTVYVTLADGLYYIKNASSDLCLQATADQAYIYEQKTDQTTRINQLWKITYNSNNKRYVIQPIEDLSVAMIANSSGYVAVDEVAVGTYWMIIHNTFGYAIQYVGDSSQTSQPVVAGMPGSQVYLGTWESNSSCHWEFESADGIFLRDTETLKAVSASTKIQIELGQTYTLADLGLSYEYYGSLIGGMTWSSSNTSAATVDSSGAVFGKGSGETIITLSASIARGEYIEQYTLSVEASHVHKYILQGTLAKSHPHLVKYVCECGDSYESVSLSNICATCLENVEPLTVTITRTVVFAYLGSEDLNYAIPIFAPIECTIIYTNNYSYPDSLSYDYPPFASFSSAVTPSYVYAGNGTADFPGLFYSASPYVNYYSSSDALLDTQSMKCEFNGIAHPSNLNEVFTLEARPAYATTSVVFMIDGLYAKAETIEVIANFP